MLKLRFVSDVGFEILNLSAPPDRFVSCNLLFSAFHSIVIERMAKPQRLLWALQPHTCDRDGEALPAYHIQSPEKVKTHRRNGIGAMYGSCLFSKTLTTRFLPKLILK